jgi:hypothetical protein
MSSCGRGGIGNNDEYLPASFPSPSQQNLAVSSLATVSISSIAKGVFRDSLDHGHCLRGAIVEDMVCTEAANEVEMSR